LSGRTVFWTKERTDRAAVLHAELQSWNKVAKALTIEWGRPITFGGVTNAHYKVSNPGWWRKYQRNKTGATRPGAQAPAVRAELQSRLCRRPTLGTPSLTARLMGDPPPGRTPWS
jgi:hypothetical protein